jgi:hypothetical protein
MSGWQDRIERPDRSDRRKRSDRPDRSDRPERSSNVDVPLFSASEDESPERAPMHRKRSSLPVM